MPTDSGERLMELLPSIYRKSERLPAFLSVYEALLFRSSDLPDEKPSAGFESLEHMIDGLPTLISPEDAPPSFLAWLGQWVALSLDETISEPCRRELIARLIPLYQMRGTRNYVAALIQLYTGAAAAVEEEELPGLSIGVLSSVGHDTRLGEDPFRFHVRLDLSRLNATREVGLRLVALARRVVDLAKPAHTYYRLSHNVSEPPLGFIVSLHSRVGIDSVL